MNTHGTGLMEATVICMHNHMFSWKNKKNIKTFCLKTTTTTTTKTILSSAMDITGGGVLCLEIMFI